jgi:hypothetical protein
MESPPIERTPQKVSHLRQNGQNGMNLGLVNALAVDKIALPAKPARRPLAGKGKRPVSGVQLEP